MSSTNKTTNYELPQFLGTDKPAWLGDINPAFTAIDTAMHNNAVKAQQGVTDASTAQTTADSAYTRAGTAIEDAGTAQTTANTAIANIASLANKLKLDNVTEADISGASVCTIKLAQSSDGSVFKLYGTLQYNLPSNSTARTAIAGLSGYYGIASGLYLLTAPDEAYVVEGSGYNTVQDSTNGRNWYRPMLAIDFAVGTDGQIYLKPFAYNEAEAGISGYIVRNQFYPSLYFNSNFGDDITPASE